MTLALDIPELETDRLRLRAPALSDFEALVDFYAGPRSRFVGGPLRRDEVWRGFAAVIGHWALRGYGFWSIELRETGACAGRVGLWFPEGWPEPEVGWTLLDGFEGRGYATEGARAARTYAYDMLGWPTAVSLIDVANAPSKAVAERLGAWREGEFDHPAGWRGEIWRHPAPAEAAA
ncbi:MAG: GNAT family N-acetyltransferase [Pseudomonadota bacterium]